MTDIVRVLSIDRIERRADGVPLVLLSDDEDQRYTIEAGQLPVPATEGAVLRVPFTAGAPEWGATTRDLAEEQRRLDALAAQRARLVRDDPGGDLAI